MNDKIYRYLVEIVDADQVLVDEPMKNHTSFKVGGPVDYMVLPKKIEDIREIIKLSKTEHLPLFIMGNGSNLLVKDKGIRGIVVKISKKFSHVEIIGERVIAQTGVLLSGLAKLFLNQELTGFEFASGIPGSLGGAVTMNAGAYGGEMKDVLEKVEVMDQEGKTFTLKGKDMRLGYRTSAIQENNLIAISATLQLKRARYQNIKSKMEDLDHRRKSKQPLEWPSAGSTFRRPEGYYAGKLVQDVGLKGFSMGKAQVSELHSGFVINKGDATAEEIINLIYYIQDKVKHQYGVHLATEVKIIGED